MKSYDVQRFTTSDLIHLGVNSTRDRQAILDFQRFLELMPPAPKPGEPQVRILVDWRWLAYVRGEMGAPPLLWAGDNA
jgi:hypothetical protein